MICTSCTTRDHVGCQTPSCTCGHSPSPVRALTTAERHAVMLDGATGNVRVREVGDEG
jgi:hypothetical protein